MSRFTACLANRRRARPWGGQIGVNRGHQRVGFDRFEVHRLGAEEKATLEIDAGISSMKQDHRALGASGLDSCEELESVAVRHVDVGEDELHVFPVQHVECLEPVRRRVHPEPLHVKSAANAAPSPGQSSTTRMACVPRSLMNLMTDSARLAGHAGRPLRA